MSHWQGGDWDFINALLHYCHHWIIGLNTFINNKCWPEVFLTRVRTRWNQTILQWYILRNWEHYVTDPKSKRAKRWGQGTELIVGLQITHLVIQRTCWVAPKVTYPGPSASIEIKVYKKWVDPVYLLNCHCNMAEYMFCSLQTMMNIKLQRTGKL